MAQLTQYTVQIAKGYKNRYRTKWVFDNERQAMFYYMGLNIHSGHKKRLLEDGVVIHRVIT